ncbi:hypothetical protein [Kutzneria sp. 744]|uniref:hypothetical protein n=1 Tax=Kutzneria sp. (strain 744) TaxID=345341 RepID=UPI0004B79591|nr:hypothetical protein [Kutzneria sp. 744]
MVLLFANTKIDDDVYEILCGGVRKLGVPLVEVALAEPRDRCSRIGSLSVTAGSLRTRNT